MVQYHPWSERNNESVQMQSDQVHRTGIENSSSITGLSVVLAMTSSCVSHRSSACVYCVACIGQHFGYVDSRNNPFS